MRNLRTWTAGVAVLMAGAAIAVGIMPSEAAAPRRNIALILDYQTAKSCTVYPNYPKAGVRGNNIGWKINPGDKVSWRYNVNRTWAVISDVKYEHSQHPWWGFTHRSCIGGSIGGEHFPTPTSSYPAGKPILARTPDQRGRRAVDQGVRTPGEALGLDPDQPLLNLASYPSRSCGRPAGGHRSDG